MTSNLLRDGRTSFPPLQEKFTASTPPRGVDKAVTTDSSITVINKRRRSAGPRPPQQGDDDNVDDDDDDDDNDKNIIPTFPPTGRTVAADATPRRARDEGYIDARGW